MSASRKTITEVISILEDWRKDAKINRGSLMNLLERLARVKGNQSFRATTAMLLAAYRKEWIHEVHPGIGGTAISGAAVRPPDSGAV